MNAEYLEYSSRSLTSLLATTSKDARLLACYLEDLEDEVSRVWQSHNGRPIDVLILRKWKEPFRLSATTHELDRTLIH